MSRFVDRAIAEYAAELESALPEDVKRLIELANSDLYSGPVYLDQDGEECSMWDDGATPFSFRKACDRIREALSDVSDVYLEDWSGCVLTSEPEGYEDEETGAWIEPDPYTLIEASALVRAIVGRELASYVS